MITPLVTGTVLTVDGLPNSRPHIWSWSGTEYYFDAVVLRAIEQFVHLIPICGSDTSLT